MIYKYYGPPGTGKTFKLISRAKAYARLGTPLHKIGYFAFSKKAAGVAKERMPASDKKLPYFLFCSLYMNGFVASHRLTGRYLAYPPLVISTK